LRKHFGWDISTRKCRCRHDVNQIRSENDICVDCENTLARRTQVLDVLVQEKLLPWLNSADRVPIQVRNFQPDIDQRRIFSLGQTTGQQVGRQKHTFFKRFEEKSTTILAG
jgi:hypothetical protein